MTLHVFTLSDAKGRCISRVQIQMLGFTGPLVQTAETVISHLCSPRLLVVEKLFDVPYCLELWPRGGARPIFEGES